MRFLSWFSVFLGILLIIFDFKPLAAQTPVIERSQEICPGVEAHIRLLASEATQETALSAINHALTGARESCIILGEWDSRSQTKQLSQYAGQRPVAVGRDLKFLLPQVLSLADQTSGAFDPTAWSKKSESRYTDIWYDASTGQAMLKRKGATVSFRGLLNGYLADRIAARLEGLNFHRYLISVGKRVVKAQGMGEHSSWMVGIDDPRQPQADSVCRVALVDRSMVTVNDSAWVSEINSFPGAASFLSVTVLAPYAYEANALANAAMVMGARIQPLIESVPHRGAVLMDHNGRLQVFGSVPAACMF